MSSAAGSSEALSACWVCGLQNVPGECAGGVTTSGLQAVELEENRSESRSVNSHLPSYISVQVAKAIQTMLPCSLENLFLNIKIETKNF